VQKSYRYDELARATGRPGWWRPVVGTLLLFVLCGVGAMVMYFKALGIAEGLGAEHDAEGLPILGDVGETASGLAGIAAGIPALALTVWVVQRRAISSVVSVTGRIRWSWLGRCFAVAVVIFVVNFVASVFVPRSGESAEEPWVGWGTFLLSVLMLVALVPLQAAAEEFIFRGWLLQAMGSLLRNPVLVVVPQGLLFAAAHGWGTAWGFADLAVFGLAMGWLTIRTGGLEAAIALHAVGNLISFVMSSAFEGGLASDETAADLPWEYALVDMGATLLFAVLVVRLAKRYKPAVVRVAQ